jgi:hypothetical protein
MTTEIAVLNRLGIALAADSAVTISGGGTTKVFDSADKLFELSCLHPVALMLNGNMDCFGIPWEIIIKDFRELARNGSGKSVSDWAVDFINYVETRSDVLSAAGRSYVQLIAEFELQSLKEKVSEQLWRGVSHRPPPRNKSVDDVMKPMILASAIERRKELAKEPTAKSLNCVKTEDIVSEYYDFLKQLIRVRLNPVSINEEIESEIIMLIADALRALATGDSSTGLIIAGYGDGDNYPSVYSIDIDGYVGGRLKYSEIKSRATIVRPELGYAVSFAQTDVIERLLSGADPRFIVKTEEFLLNAAKRLAPAFREVFAPKASKKRAELFQERALDILKLIAQEYVETTSPSFQSEFREEFEKMIAMMPKLELIELAEALISITAIERKATADEGTVGGPIDVAFITKHEGFVWIKRKHYFKPDLNPRYFWRKFREKTGEAHEGAKNPKPTA